jgi:hypothetical protein
MTLAFALWILVACAGTVMLILALALYVMVTHIEDDEA